MRREVPGRSWFARSAGIVTALVLGAWLSAVLWPQWRERNASQPVLRHLSQAAQVPAHAPPSAPEKSASQLGTDASVSPRRLKLVLVAATPGHTLADSTAALGTDARNPQVYAGGALLSNGARIVDIRPDRVTLSLRGRSSILRVEPAATNRVVPSNAIEARHPASPSIADDDPAGVGAAADAGDRLARVASSREDLSDQVRPQPEFANGQVSGLVVFPGTDASRLASLGLEAGDVIRAVAGVPVRSEAAWQEIDDVLSSGGSLVVGIERKGKRLSISIDGARLADDVPSPIEHQ
jgi:type II secretion system protein C